MQLCIISVGTVGINHVNLYNQATCMGIFRQNTAVIIDGRTIRKIFGGEIGGITEFGQVWKEVWAGMVSEERDRQVRWEDGRFT